MAANPANVMTLTDIAKGLDPNGQIAAVIEVLNAKRSLLSDMPFITGNLPNGHRTTVRTGLPEVFWRLANEGVPPSNADKAQHTDVCGLVESWSEIAQEVAEFGGNAAAVRASEARTHIEAMGQEVESTFFYGNQAVSPREFTGLSVRYSSLSAINARNIINLAGTQDSPSDLTSIWLLDLGEETVCGIAPQGSKTGGLMHEDLGLETAETTAGVGGTRLRVYRDRFQMQPGLAVKDWRGAVRICNIDVSDQRAVDPITTASALLNAMSRAVNRLENPSGRCRYYANRTIHDLLDEHAQGAVSRGGGITYQNVDGQPVKFWRGIPIRVTDALLSTEDAVA